MSSESSSSGTDRSPGPVPQGAPQTAVPPKGDPTAAGPPLGREDAEADAPVDGLGGDVEGAEAIEADLAALLRERDEYLDSLRRLQADFENYRKRVMKQQTEHLERAAEGLVSKLLDVFDTVRLAVEHGGGEAVEQVAGKLFEVLGKEGLEVVSPDGDVFDPGEHEAVAHEEGEGPAQVVEVLRTGYKWKGRVLRPAMVKVKGS